MTPNTIPAHSDIDPKYTWNAPSVFPTVEAWEAECASVAADLAGLQQYQGHLADGPAVLADAMTAIQRPGRARSEVVHLRRHVVRRQHQRRCRGEAQRPRAGLVGPGHGRQRLSRPRAACHRRGDAANVAG